MSNQQTTQGIDLTRESQLEVLWPPQRKEQQVIQFFHSKDKTVHKEDSKMKPVIPITFTNRKHKTELLKQGKRLKVKGADVSGCLTLQRFQLNIQNDISHMYNCILTSQNCDMCNGSEWSCRFL